MILDYFAQIFSSSNAWVDFSFLDFIEPKIDETIGLQLTADFTAGEVGLALHHMHSIKSPGLMAWRQYFSKNTGR